MYVDDLTLTEAVEYRKWREDDLLLHPEDEQIRWDIEDLDNRINELAYTDLFTPDLIE